MYEVDREGLSAPVSECVTNKQGKPIGTEDKCRAAGCVWLPRFAGPKCQHTRPHTPGGRADAVVDCAPGQGDVTAAGCHDKGCGWFPGPSGPPCRVPTRTVIGPKVCVPVCVLVCV